MCSSDLIADWLRRHGDRHVGGGFATVDPQGVSLLETNPDRPAAWTTARADDGSTTPWDWTKSGVAEMNCFLCHVESPANDARVAALRDGRFGEAATATLAETGLIDTTDDGWTWTESLFDAKGAVSPRTLGLTRSTGAACGQCHGTVVARPDEAFWFAPEDRRRGTETTGVVFAPGRKIGRAHV